MVPLAAGHVRLVAVGKALVVLVLVEVGDMVPEGVEDREAEGLEFEEDAIFDTDVEAEVGDLTPEVVVRAVVETAGIELVSGQVAPGSQGLIEQHPLKPF